jgi:hypothetical protein
MKTKLLLLVFFLTALLSSAFTFAHPKPPVNCYTLKWNTTVEVNGYVVVTVIDRCVSVSDGEVDNEISFTPMSPYIFDLDGNKCNLESWSIKLVTPDTNGDNISPVLNYLDFRGNYSCGEPKIIFIPLHSFYMGYNYRIFLPLVVR